MTQSGYPVYGATGIIGYYSQYNHSEPVIAISCRGNASGMVMLTQGAAFVNANAICLENPAKNICREYLYYYLMRQDLSPLLTGAAQPQLTIRDLETLWIELPDLPKQQYIAKLLSCAERVHQLRQAQQQRLRCLQQAYLAELMQTLGATPHIPTVPLADVVHIHVGRQNASAAQANGKYPFFTCAAEPKRINSCPFDGEFVLINGNMDIHVRYYKGAFDAYQRIYALQSRSPEKLHMRYLYLCLLHRVPLLQQLTSGVVIKYLRKHQLEQLEIPLPPLHLQQKICQRYAAMLQLEEHLQQAETHAKDLFRSLLQRYIPIMPTDSPL